MDDLDSKKNPESQTKTPRQASRRRSISAKFTSSNLDVGEPVRLCRFVQIRILWPQRRIGVPASGPTRLAIRLA